MLKVVAGGLAAAILVAPAFAATEYWVVQNPTTKKCTIVEQKPTASTEVVIGNTAFKTRSEAETSMKTTKICTSQ